MAKKPREPKATKPACGLVMPISDCDGCAEAHWSEVKTIIQQSLQNDFDLNMVSYRPAVAIIQENIVVNLRKNPLVVCDVSGQNPNCMIELGMRLAFDLPIVVLKDDATKFTFDISPIEHISYPRNLRFAAIEAFKKDLRRKAKDTYDESQKEKNFSQFLKQFKDFESYEPKPLDTIQETTNQQILRVLNELSQRVNQLASNPSSTFSRDFSIDFDTGKQSPQYLYFQKLGLAEPTTKSPKQTLILELLKIAADEKRPVERRRQKLFKVIKLLESEEIQEKHPVWRTIIYARIVDLRNELNC